jgi:ribosomal-protein-alanine N-acetyltransferase
MPTAAPTYFEWVDQLPEVWTERLHLRIAHPDEAPLLHGYAVRNRARLEKWEATRPGHYYELASWKSVPDEDRRQVESGEGARFRLFDRESPGKMIGVVGLRDIVHREVQSASIGYSIDALYEGKGLMTEAVEAVIQFAFEYHQLHRIEACCMPTNLGSRRVLEKLGFVNEGRLRESLRVAGRWEDHLLWGLLARDWAERSRAKRARQPR